VEETNNQTTGALKLVLGFDAGCMTCSGLARSIEEAVGDKLEIRSLTDPAVEYWRRQALGEYAPWAPTLFEVKPASIRAWTGRRMGLVLASKLGLAATWRVMQVLGDVRVGPAGADTLGANAAGLSRGQFLKGMGGATLAMSLLSGAAAIPSLANAKEASTTSRGTLAQRKAMENSVRSSKHYRNATKKAGRHFDFKRAEFAVNGALRVGAVVLVAKAAGGRRAAVATFFTDLENNAVVSDSYTVQARTGDATVVTQYENGERLTEVTFEDRQVLLSDGRRIAYEEFKENSEHLGRQTAGPFTEPAVLVSARYCKNGCCRGSFNWCMLITRLQCMSAGAINFWLGLACRYLRAYSNSKRAGCNAYATDRCYRLNRCGYPFMR
jgi:hypothetical protein